jgi:hypothetical protein
VTLAIKHYEGRVHCVQHIISCVPTDTQMLETPLEIASAQLAVHATVFNIFNFTTDIFVLTCTYLCICQCLKLCTADTKVTGALVFVTALVSSCMLMAHNTVGSG